MKIGILHLTDLHIQDEIHEERVEKLVKAIEYDIKQLSNLYIVFSGDIANFGRKSEYENAKLFLNELLEKIKPNGRLLQIDIVAVPGNHDCCFDNEKKTRKSIINDCKIDVFRASGNGGQCVNTTDSAVRITHLPTGIVVSCQDEKSQLKNKDKAMKVLRSRIYDLEQEKADSEQAEKRRNQIGTGDRSEKIRTYNFPQGRVTDHRIKYTSHRLTEILAGDLNDVIQNIIAADQTARLSHLNDEA